MFYFTTEKSAGYGARIFIQNATNPNQTDCSAGLHELAKELSFWRGPDKSVSIPPQDCSEAWAKTGKAGFNGTIGSTILFAGYEMDLEELVVMEKRCKVRGMVNVTPILRDLKQEWR